MGISHLQQFLVCLVCVSICHNSCSYSLQVRCISYNTQINLFVSLGQTIQSVSAAENVAVLYLCLSCAGFVSRIFEDFLDAFSLISKNCHSCCGVTSHVELMSVPALVCAVSTEDSHEAKFIPYLSVCFMYFSLPSSSNWLFVFCDHQKSFSFFALNVSLQYVSLVTAEDCWYPFSCCIISTLWSCYAVPLSSLPKDHPNFCVQLWSQCGVFSKAWFMVSCVLQDTSDRWVQYRYGYICIPSVNQSWWLGH